MTPEARVKVLVRRRLQEEFGLQCYAFWPVQTGRGARTLDCLFCVDSLFFAVETKRPGADLTEIQKDISGEIWRAGGVVYKVDGAVSCNYMIADIKWRIAHG